jgi:hypothetical protein
MLRPYERNDEWMTMTPAQSREIIHLKNMEDLDGFEATVLFSICCYLLPLERWKPIFDEDQQYHTLTQST